MEIVWSREGSVIGSGIGSRIGSRIGSGIWETKGGWDNSHTVLKWGEGRETFETSAVS
jgi:hypothetical protein